VAAFQAAALGSYAVYAGLRELLITYGAATTVTATVGVAAAAAAAGAMDAELPGRIAKAQQLALGAVVKSLRQVDVVTQAGRAGGEQRPSALRRVRSPTRPLAALALPVTTAVVVGAGPTAFLPVPAGGSANAPLASPTVFGARSPLSLWRAGLGDPGGGGGPTTTSTANVAALAVVPVWRTDGVVPIVQAYLVHTRRMLKVLAKVLGMYTVDAMRPARATTVAAAVALGTALHRLLVAVVRLNTLAGTVPVAHDEPAVASAAPPAPPAPAAPAPLAKSRGRPSAPTATATTAGGSLSSLGLVLPDASASSSLAAATTATASGSTAASPDLRRPRSDSMDTGTPPFAQSPPTAALGMLGGQRGSRPASRNSVRDVLAADAAEQLGAPDRRPRSQSYNLLPRMRGLGGGGGGGGGHRSGSTGLHGAGTPPNGTAASAAVSARSTLTSSSSSGGLLASLSLMPAAVVARFRRRPTTPASTDSLTGTAVAPLAPPASARASTPHGSDGAGGGGSGGGDGSGRSTPSADRASPSLGGAAAATTTAGASGRSSPSASPAAGLNRRSNTVRSKSATVEVLAGAQPGSGSGSGGGTASASPPVARTRSGSVQYVPLQL
jgi:hypothetical protein